MIHPYASTTSPLDLNTRTLRPSSSSLKPTRSPFCAALLNSATLETWIGISFSIMPPVTPLIGLGLACFLTIPTPSTTTWSVSSTRRTVPRLPLSLPVMTTTSSPLRILFIPISLQHFGRQRNDLHEAFATELTRHRPEN